MDSNRLLFLKAFVKLLALQHLRHRKFRCQPDKVLSRHLGKPARVEIDHGLLRIKNLKDLRFVSLSVAVDIGAGERRTRDRSARGVADHPGKISNEEDYRVSQILKML